MLVRSRAPLRLGIAGGGTDVSPYSDAYGGCVLNATINMYAHCTIEVGTHLNTVSFVATDIGEESSFELNEVMELGGDLQLHKAVYRRIVSQFCEGVFFPVCVTTCCDAPPGSGLGSSSTVVVAIVEAFKQALYLPLG
ncbi:MAG: dehydrogenase, partial [Colwellia sp.]